MMLTVWLLDNIRSEGDFPIVANDLLTQVGFEIVWGTEQLAKKQFAVFGMNRTEPPDRR